jgi:predicted RNase H-like HicB family nuclease
MGVVSYRSENGYQLAQCLSLRGSKPQGETREQAVANPKAGIQGYVKV